MIPPKERLAMMKAECEAMRKKLLRAMCGMRPGKRTQTVGRKTARIGQLQIEIFRLEHDIATGAVK